MDHGPSGSEQPQRKHNSSFKAAAKENAKTLGRVVVVVFLLRAFVVEAYEVSSESMEHTLKVGDKLFANRFVYGLKIPWVEYKLVDGRSPKAGEIILFVHPRENEKTLIKRVIAVGGDIVTIKDNVIYRNGWPVQRHRLQDPVACPEAATEPLAPPQQCLAFEEELSGMHYHVYQHEGVVPDNRAPQKIPPGHVFVMGDNRDNSSDSRFWGTVPYSHIKGKAMFIWWSRGGEDGVRWDRLFRSVEAL